MPSILEKFEDRFLEVLEIEQQKESLKSKKVEQKKIDLP
jgi:hypothetical protein